MLGTKNASNWWERRGAEVKTAERRDESGRMEDTSLVTGTSEQIRAGKIKSGDIIFPGEEFIFTSVEYNLSLYQR